MMKELISRLRQSEAVTQKHPLGCGVACVAFLSGKSYTHTLHAFRNAHDAWTQGFYCPELTSVLSRFGFTYQWRKLSRKSQQKTIIPNGSIIFVAPSRRYPHGHFLVKCGANRYMNPWKNFPDIAPAVSGFDRAPPGEITYVVEPIS